MSTTKGAGEGAAEVVEKRALAGDRDGGAAVTWAWPRWRASPEAALGAPLAAPLAALLAALVAALVAAVLAMGAAAPAVRGVVTPPARRCRTRREVRASTFLDVVLKSLPSRLRTSMFMAASPRFSNAAPPNMLSFARVMERAGPWFYTYVDKLSCGTDHHNPCVRRTNPSSGVRRAVDASPTTSTLSLNLLPPNRQTISRLLLTMALRSPLRSVASQATALSRR